MSLLAGDVVNEKHPLLPASLTITAVPSRRDLLVLPPLESTPLDRSVEKRRIRKHYVLNVVRERGPLSRAEIAKESGLNLPSVSSLVDELIEGGLVAENEARQALRGRRPIPVMLRPEAASVLGIDIGKRSTTVLLADLSAKTLFTTEIPTPSLISPEAYARWAVEAAEKVFSQCVDTMPPLCGIGVAVAGLVSNEITAASVPASFQLMPSEIPAAAAEAVRQALQLSYNVEVFVDNDARIMVPGYKWFSQDNPDFDSFVVLNIGYGLGLGVSLDGQLLRGSQGFAGEIGHIPLGRPDIACYCGRLGCLENTASGAAISSMARQQGLPAAEVEELAAMARKGNRTAQVVFEAFATALGRGVATIISLFNPEAIILTGKVTRASDVYFDYMLKSVRLHTLPDSLANVRILIANPESNLSSLGAVALILHKIYYSSHISFEEVI